MNVTIEHPFCPYCSEEGGPAIFQGSQRVLLYVSYPGPGPPRSLGLRVEVGVHDRDPELCV